MCEFCTVVKSNSLYDKCKKQNNFWIDIWLNDGSADINCECGEYEACMQINYCPMCGRKLEV